MAYYIRPSHGSNDINKFYRNFFWLKFKVTLQDIQYFCSKYIRIRQLTNVTVCEIPLRRGQLHCNYQKLHLLNKTLQNNNTLHLRLFFKGKLYTLRMKNPIMNNPHPPFPFPVTTLQFSFLAVVISILST